MPSDVSVSDEELQKCYEAFTRRRLTRGEQSIRTPEGFQRLHTRYQRHITTVSDPATSKDEEAEDSACRRNILNWVIPELPRRQVQELVQYDWELDRKYDELGMDGLSLQGFQLSLLDLLISCTDGTVAKCLEFLNLMARWLQHSLPPYIIKDSTPQVDEDLATTNDLKQLTKAIAAKIVWKTVPFSVMTPSPISKHGLYCELKTKACSAPIAIMILAATENPIELVLAPSSKTLLRKRESRNNKEGACWTFSVSPKSSSVLLVPGSTVRRQTKALYACFRSPISRVDSCIDGDESDRRERSETQNAASSADLTLFTSVPELIFLKFGSKRYKMERMSSRIFTVERSDKTFTITLTGPFLQSSHSTGEPPVLSTLETNSTFSISDSYPRDDDVRQSDAHTFVFILESPVLRNNGLKHDQAIQPRQWFTSMNSANVTKTIIFNSSECGDKVKETQTKEMYQLFVFTLHGVNIEVACNSGNLERNREESEPEAQETDADNPNKFPEVTSSSLLKELLQLQRTRQQEKASEPLPDMVIGMQVSASKPATTAESLRSKILRSRQDERYARYLQLQSGLQIKILEEKPSRKSPVSRKPRDFNESVETPLSPMSELKKRVNQLTTFFHEMAVHQPRDDELHGSAVEAAEAVAEEQLLKRFSDMFDYDADLQNALGGAPTPSKSLEDGIPCAQTCQR
ncbi:hypothetical protein PInf_021720 [Phytophthora infestans]|nr:hypothetical protein PInf_021720 [Phytophthora infestans]